MIGQQYYTPEAGWIRKDIVNNQDELTIVGGSFYNPGFLGPDATTWPIQYNFKSIAYMLPKEAIKIRVIAVIASSLNVEVYLGDEKIGVLPLYTNVVPSGQNHRYTSCFEYDVSLTKETELSIRSTYSGGNWYVQFHAFDYLLGSPEYYILHDDSYKTITEAGLQTLTDFATTPESMQTNGFTDAQMLAGIADQLSSSFELLRYHPDSANTSVQLNHLPAPQLIAMTEDIDLSAYRLIKQITLTTTGSTGIAKVIFSFDGGASWRTYADGAWAAIEPIAHAVAASGVTEADVAAIPAGAWTAVTGPVRVAYYLAKAAATDDLAVAQLAITGDTASWDKARHMTDYDYEYPSTATLLVKLLADGSYKINRMNGGER